MRAYPALVIKEQGLLDIIGANRIQTPAPTSQTGCRNNEQLANTEGARQIGCKFTRQEWETIFLYSTRNLTGRQTDAEQTQRFRRFYSRFGPSSPLRTPQEYGAGLSNFRIPMTVTTFQWNYILANLQNVLRDAQQWRASETRGGEDLSDDEIMELARALQRATRGVNFNEGEIIYNLRQLQNQNDYDRLVDAYTAIDTVGRNLEEVLNQLNVEERQTIARILQQKGIRPSETFNADERSETEPQFDPYSIEVDSERFPENESYTATQAQEYATLILNGIAERLGTGEGELGLQFFNFVRSDAEAAVFFRQQLEALATEGINRRQLNIRIAALMRRTWPVFEIARNQQ